MPNFPKNDGYRMSKGPIPRNYSNAPVMKDEKSNKEKADRLNSMANKYSDDPSFRAAQTKYNQKATNDETSGLPRYGKHGPKRLKGNQTKIDKNKDGKISKADFDMMNGMPRYGKHGKGMPKTYKEAFKTREKKYQGMGEAEYIKEAKAQNLKKYGTTKPSTEKSLSKEKKTELKTQQAAQAKTDATGKDKKRNDAARISNATVTEKKAAKPKKKVTVKGAKDSKKAGVRDAKQKGYETKKDRKEAISDARKSGKAGVKGAKEKAKLAKSRERAMNKDSKMQAKAGRKEVKAAVKGAKNKAKASKLQDKIDKSSKVESKVSSKRNLKRADKINKLNA